MLSYLVNRIFGSKPFNTQLEDAPAAVNGPVAKRPGSRILETGRITGSGYGNLTIFDTAVGQIESGGTQAYVEILAAEGALAAGNGLLVQGDRVGWTKHVLTRKSLARAMAMTDDASRGREVGEKALVALEAAEHLLAEARRRWAIAALELGILDNSDASESRDGRPCLTITRIGHTVQRHSGVALVESENGGYEAVGETEDLCADDFLAIASDRTLTDALRQQARIVAARLVWGPAAACLKADIRDQAKALPDAAGGTWIAGGEHSAGAWQIREDDEGVRRHYRNGVVEFFELRGRIYEAESAVAKAWFADGVTAKDRKPVFVERLESPFGPDPDRGVLSAQEIWEDPERGTVTVPRLEAVDVEREPASEMAFGHEPGMA